MKKQLIERADKLLKAFEAEGFDTTANLRLRPLSLILVIKLKGNYDADQIMKEWEQVRAVSGS